MRVISVERADDFVDYRPEEPGHGLQAVYGRYDGSQRNYYRRD